MILRCAAAWGMLVAVKAPARGGGAGGGEGGAVDRVRMTRAELEKSRIRKTTEGGADIAVSLPPGTVLRDGDLLDAGGGEMRILVEQMPEKVATARPAAGRGREGSAAAFLVGHIVGNRHRPISVSADGASISFPLQAESEAEVFRSLFGCIDGGVDLQVSEGVFRPHGGADVRGHE